MLHIGIDAGGSKTKLLARAKGLEDVILSGPAANLQTAGVDGAARIFADLVQEAIQMRQGIPLRAVCAGVSGAGRPHDCSALEAAWRKQLGETAPAHLHVVHDAMIALEAAFEGESGIIVIVGTGSIAFAKSEDGSLHRVGGWGYLLGDEGSGFAIGLDGLRSVTAALDGGPATRLQELIAERLGLLSAEEIIHSVYQKLLHIPSVAPLVLEAAEAGDAISQDIVKDQLGRLARQLRWLVKRCGPVKSQLAPIGGLAQNPFFRARLEHSLLTALPDWKILAPKHDPVIGALRLAMQTGNIS